MAAIWSGEVVMRKHAATVVLRRRCAGGEGPAASDPAHWAAAGLLPALPAQLARPACPAPAPAPAPAGGGPAALGSPSPASAGAAALSAPELEAGAAEAELSAGRSVLPTPATMAPAEF